MVHNTDGGRVTGTGEFEVMVPSHCQYRMFHFSKLQWPHGKMGIYLYLPPRHLLYTLAQATYKVS
jgi:hypothetical protein